MSVSISSPGSNPSSSLLQALAAPMQRNGGGDEFAKMLSQREAAQTPPPAAKPPERPAEHAAEKAPPARAAQQAPKTSKTPEKTAAERRLAAGSAHPDKAAVAADSTASPLAAEAQAVTSQAAGTELEGEEAAQADEKTDAARADGTPADWLAAAQIVPKTPLPDPDTADRRHAADSKGDAAAGGAQRTHGITGPQSGGTQNKTLDAEMQRQEALQPSALDTAQAAQTEWAGAMAHAMEPAAAAATGRAPGREAGALQPADAAAALANLSASAAEPTGASPSAAPTVVAVPTPATAPEFPQALGTQLSLLARDGVQQAELHLNPADMGPISVQIELNGSQAQVDFGADSAATRQIIENGLPELAAALRDAGFTLSGGGVHHQARGGGREGGANDSRNRGQRGDGRADLGGTPEPVSTAQLARVGRTATGGVDLYA